MRRLAVAAAALGMALGLLAPAGCASAPSSPRANEPRPAASGLDLTGLDRAVRAPDGLFAYANGGWLRTVDIPPDRTEVGTFSDLAVRVEDEQRAVIAQSLDAPMALRAATGPDSLARKVGDMYASFMDTDRLETLKATPLNADFAAVDKLTGPQDLAPYLGALRREEVSNPIGLEVRPDERNPTVNVAEVSQSGLTLPDRDDYLSDEPRKAQLRDAYRGYVTKMLALAGTPDPAGGAAAVLDLETRLARLQWTDAQNADPAATYHKLTVRDAHTQTGLDWSGYLNAIGLSTHDLVLAQLGYFSGLGELVRTVPVATWKAYLRWHLLSAAAPYLSSDFVNTRFDFMGTLLGGQGQDRERWRRGIAAVNATMGDAFGQLYVKQYYSGAITEQVQRLVDNILGEFRRSIDTLDWMSPVTKAEARKKLSALTVRIGYPHEWQDWSLLQVRPDDLLGNVRRAAEIQTRHELEDSGDEVDHRQWFGTPQTPSATYRPSRNELTLPAAILRAPLFDAGADDAANYGALGVVIAREISHAFDEQGRQYDAAGVRRDWWTPSDAAAFAAKTQPLVARYNGFEPLPGTHVNGQLTLAENIADLSGVSVAAKAYQASLGGTNPPIRDGFTGPQRFFLSYAQMWRAKQTDESLRRSLRTDPHSPAQFRTDGVVDNLPEFYAAWDVTPADREYLSPEQRILIW